MGEIIKNKKSLSSKNHWEGRNKYKLHKVESSCYKKYFNKYLPVDSTKNCIEIGAVPGDHLIYLAKYHKFHPTGLDYLNDIYFVGKNLNYNNITEFELIKDDFLKWAPKKKYDIVCSFGFVEHFENYKDVIKKHMRLVNNGGFLVLTVPYLRYFQLWLRRLVYVKEYYEKIMNIHNIEIMNLRKFEEIINSENNFVKLFSGYIREMTIWFEPTDSFVIENKRYILKILKSFEKSINKIIISNRFTSPEIMIIAQKQI